MRKISIREKGFTLIELIVVIGIIILLAGGSLLSYKTLLDKTRKIAGETNLRAINLALNMYLHDYGRFPSTGSDLVNALAEYNVSPFQFHDPNDPIKSRNTYAPFYVKRSNRPDSSAFVLGCPYYSHKGKSLVLLYGYDPEELENLKATLNNSPVEFGKSMSLKAGDKVEYYLKDGNKFADVDVKKDIENASVIAAFSLPNGKPYGIFKVNDAGEVDVSVKPGSRFEVVTPSTIAGVQGTEFTVEVNISGDEYITTINVGKGKVMAYTYPETLEATLDSIEVKKVKFLIEAGHQGIVKIKFPSFVPESIKVTPHYVRMKVGKTVDFDAIGYDDKGEEISVDQSKVKWKLIPYLWECGSINEDGEYTATRRGIDKVMAKVGPRKAYAYIYVK